MAPDLELLLSFFAPIRELLLDDTVTEIMGNPDGSWWYERAGKLLHADVEFDFRGLATGIEVIANTLGHRLDAEHRILNVQLPGGSRLAAVLQPVVRPGPAVTIRKFPQAQLRVQDLVAVGTLTQDAATYLCTAVADGHTMLISGGTGSGKTTLLNALAEYIPAHQRIVVIEDTAELRLAKPNVFAAECQTSAGGVNFDTLLRASLRWRPDRIILGEVRGEEARTLLDSFNTGHAGSITTIHASSAVRALRRLTALAMRSHQQETRDDVAQEVAESVELVVQMDRTPRGRRVTQVIRVACYDRERKNFITETIY